MRVTSLRIYPVKSMAGFAVDAADVEPWGLACDRRWALVDESGQKVTARKVHDLLGLSAELAGGNAIRIIDRDRESILVEPPERTARTAPALAGYAGQSGATCASETAGAWLTARFGRPLNLIWQDDPASRPIAADDGGLPGESLSLADAGPLLLASEASMAQLNAWIAADVDQPDLPDLDPGELSDASAGPRFEPLDIVRFRPNVVIDGDEPFAEDLWPFVQLGGVTFRKTMECDRCVMTTIEPTTLARGKEPIRTLARHRRRDRKTWFGIRLVPLGTGSISVGDAVEPAS